MNRHYLGSSTCSNWPFMTSNMQGTVFTRKSIFFLLVLIYYLGHAYAQQHDNEWLQFGTNIIGEADGDNSGHAVSLSSDGYRVAIGATSHAERGSERKRMCVRVYSLTTAWTQLGSDIDGDGNDDDFGAAVSLNSDGSHLAVGAPRTNANAGQVKVFLYATETDSWSQLGSDITGSSSGQHAGWSLSLSGDGERVAVGLPLKEAQKGHTGVYKYHSVTSSWTLMGAFIAGQATNDFGGTSVALSSDGSRLAVGIPYWNAQKGKVRVYDYDDGGSNTWRLVGDIEGNNGNRICGWSVSLSSDVVLRVAVLAILVVGMFMMVGLLQVR